MVVKIGKLYTSPMTDCENNVRFLLDRGEEKRFISCVATGKLAKLVTRHLKVGTRICVEGDWATPLGTVLIAKKVMLLLPISKQGGRKMTSKLERARLALKEHGLQGMQAFDCEAPADSRETVYEDEEITIKVSHTFGYVDILGLSDSDFKKLTRLRKGHRFVKKEI